MRPKRLSHVIPVRLPEAEFEAITELAERETRPVSNVLRRYATLAAQQAGLLPTPAEPEVCHEDPHA